MPIRRFLRASVPESRLEAVAREVVRRHDRRDDPRHDHRHESRRGPAVGATPEAGVDEAEDQDGEGEGDGNEDRDGNGNGNGNGNGDRDAAPVDFECLDADNWLSVPFVVEDRWFVKVIADQHTFVHAVLTTGRNLGAFSAGTEGFFERFSTPLEMAEHELEATRQMREIGVDAPEPIEAFEHDGLGVVVLEFLPEFRTLDELPAADVERFVPDLFGNLSRMHAAGLAHGDLRAENVLVAPDETGVETLYFIDATRVSRESGAADDATAYDLACALASLAPTIGPRAAVEGAAQFYSMEDLLAAREFLDFVNMRPDHDFESATVKGEIERAATEAVS